MRLRWTSGAHLRRGTFAGVPTAAAYLRIIMIKYFFGHKYTSGMRDPRRAAHPMHVASLQRRDKRAVRAGCARVSPRLKALRAPGWNTSDPLTVFPGKIDAKRDGVVGTRGVYGDNASYSWLAMICAAEGRSLIFVRIKCSSTMLPFMLNTKSSRGYSEMNFKVLIECVRSDECKSLWSLTAL